MDVLIGVGVAVAYLLCGFVAGGVFVADCVRGGKQPSDDDLGAFWMIVLAWPVVLATLAGWGLLDWWRGSK